MKNQRLLSFCLLFVMMVIEGPAWAAHAESASDAECRKRLKIIYEALEQYVELNEAMPASLFELLDFGLVDDPTVLFDARSIGIGHHGQARLCTPFDVVATDLAGDLVVSDEAYEARLFVLRADGSVVVRAVNVAEYYGATNAPKAGAPIDRTDLKEPSAGLGVIADTRKKQVVIRTIIPGYGTIEPGARRINDLRGGDRLINVEGRRVTERPDFEDYLRTIGPLETYGPKRPEVCLLRDGKLLRRRAMVPLSAIGAQRRDAPSVVHHKAQVYLGAAGPGAMGIVAEKNASGGVRVASVASAEARAKLRIGDVITHVEDTAVDDVDELNERIRFHPAGMVVKLRVLRNGAPTIVRFELQSMDPGVLARGRFEIHRGRLDADAALAASDRQLATSLMAMLEEARGPEAALQWANQVIAGPDTFQQLQMPQILEAWAGLAAKLGRIEQAMEGYDRAAQAWGRARGAWGARRRKVEMLIEAGRMDQARRLTRSWNLTEDAAARRAAMDITYTYVACGNLTEATNLLEKLQAVPDTKDWATTMLQDLREAPPTRRPETSMALDDDAEELIAEMVIATSENDVDRLEKLLGRSSMGPDVVGREATSPLVIAAARGHAQSVTMLLKAGADANQRYPGSRRRGNTPLLFAIGAGHADVAHLLIENGADVNCAGGKGQTPLMLAAAQKKTDIVRELLKRGAEVNRTVIERDGVPYGGYSALMVAAMNGHEDIVRMLLDSGANPNLRGADGMTARALADAAGHTAVANRIAESQR